MFTQALVRRAAIAVAAYLVLVAAICGIVAAATITHQVVRDADVRRKAHDYALEIYPNGLSVSNLEKIQAICLAESATGVVAPH
jgi:hypothetical protein